jgi:hypothetical protein
MHHICKQMFNQFQCLTVLSLENASIITGTFLLQPQIDMLGTQMKPLSLAYHNLRETTQFMYHNWRETIHTDISVQTNPMVNLLVSLL